MSVFNQRDEQGTGDALDPHPLICRCQQTGIRTASDGGRGTQYRNSVFFGGGKGGFDRRLHHADDLSLKLLGKGRHRHTGHGTAGNQDRLGLILHQKSGILQRIFYNCIFTASAVGHTTGITKVYHIFQGKTFCNLLYGGKTAQTAVKHTQHYSIPLSRAPSISAVIQALPSMPWAAISLGYILMTV